MITHTQSLSVSSTGSSPITGKVTETGNTEINLSVALAAGATNQLQAITFTIASLQSMLLMCSQPVTIKTNSSGSPAQTITLVAGAPFIWSRSSAYYANPITTDVTAFYLTATAACLLQVKVLTS